MNWYSIFYWLTVAENAKGLFVTFIVIFTTISVISWICFFVDLSEGNFVDEERRSIKNWIKWSTPFAVLFWCLQIFTPNKKDALLIIAGGGIMEFVSSDSTAKQIPVELTRFVSNELKIMAAEAKVEILSATAKEDILREARNLTTDELLQKMQMDTSFAKIILNR